MPGKAFALPIVAVVLLCGCAPREDIYFRPIGDDVLYWYTYYPELSVQVPRGGGSPPGSSPKAGARVAARGIIENRKDAAALVVNVRVVVDNPTDRSIELRRSEQYIADIDGGAHPATRMTANFAEAEIAVIGPGRKQIVRMQFRPGAQPPFEGRLSFAYRFRYRMYDRAWPEDVEFVQVMPGEVVPPPIWMGVIILRF